MWHWRRALEEGCTRSSPSPPCLADSVAGLAPAPTFISPSRPPGPHIAVLACGASAAPGKGLRAVGWGSCGASAAPGKGVGPRLRPVRV